MATVKMLSDKVKELNKGLTTKKKLSMPDDLLSDAIREIEGVQKRLAPYLPVTAEQKREAKSHPLSSQIVKTTTSDALKKQVFSKSYFEKKFRALPKEKSLVAASMPKSTAAIRDAIILYYYRLGKDNNQLPLKEFRNELESDYASNPAVKRQARAQDSLNKLLEKNDTEEIAAILLKEFPKAQDLKEFAKLANLRIPAASRKTAAAKKSVHQRLAEAISSQGSIGRMELE